MLAAILVAALPAQEAKTVDLFFGKPVEQWKYARYCTVADTYIDSSAPAENFGGSPSLIGGPGKTILIRFGDLERVLGPKVKVHSATLYLTPTVGQSQNLKGVHRMLVPWGEGPLRSLGGLLRRPDEKDVKQQPHAWSATWRERRAGYLPWQQPGGVAAPDAVPIEGFDTSQVEAEIAISGLGNTVQAMADRWFDNHGLALTFESNVEFHSSQSQRGRPRLVVEYSALSPTGPDLSVTRIDRTPEQPAKASRPWPAEGEEVTYTALIKNVGDAPSSGFGAVWIVGEKEGATLELPAPLQPGQETTLTFRKPFRLNTTDHRVQPISLEIRPKGEDAASNNDALEVHESSRTVAVDGASDLDWVQRQVRAFNETYAPFSRYSFAPNGALERVRLANDPATADGVISLANLGDSASPEEELVKAIALSLGVPDLGQANIEPADVQLEAARGQGFADRYPGVTGGGDTRFEGALLGRIPMPYDPFYAPKYEQLPEEGTGLLSATAVGVLNSMLGKRGTAAADAYALAPKTVLLLLQDLGGRSLSNVELVFYPLKEGVIPSGEPAFTLKSGSGSSVAIPQKDGAGPFGAVAQGEGAYLIRATANGASAWGWLKAWQLLDTYFRGSASAAIFEARFDLPGAPLDFGTNLARERIVSDSANTDPASLAALVDGSAATEVNLPATDKGWIEIDLGRDRTIGEIALTSGAGAMWRQFDVVTYATGQRPVEGLTWAREMDWPWTSANRSTGKTVTYRGPAHRIRYIRIINRSAAPGSLAEVSVTPIA